MKNRKIRIRIWHWVIIILVIAIVYFFKIANNYPIKQDLEHEPGFFAVTFSTKFSEELGLDWMEVYSAILDDLNAKDIRIPVYWDEIETEEGVFDFSKYDYIIAEGEKRDVDFVLNIGWRLPRWPECHAPAWTKQNTMEETQESVMKMLEEVVVHYRYNNSISAWQLENEPFLDVFGICPPGDIDFFKEELARLRELDGRPIIVSATGELSWWNREAKMSDIFGSTLYRVVWGPETGYIRYPIPAWFYRLKANINRIDKEHRYIMELQAEPWVPRGSMIYLSEEEANKSFNMRQFRANLQYAINVNFKKSYLWGVEWWYFQKENGNSDYWDLAKTLFK